MKKYILFKTVVILFMTSFAQERDCNRSVWISRFTHLLPMEICIPIGNYHITEVYERTDINGDELDDVIFDWNKNPLQDGDTIFTTVYLQNKDSTFSYYKTFNNLYPIYFEEYDWDYHVPKDEKLKEIQKKYLGRYQLRELLFKKDVIQITIQQEAQVQLRIIYKYDKTLNNWRYEKSEENFLVGDTFDFIDLSKELAPTIDNFTYFLDNE